MKYLLFFILFFTTVTSSHAYALPYPSYMPGHNLYRLSRIADELKGYWNWGSIAQCKYHLALADKYLVEAKTLFDYGQYLLAVDALNRSNQQIQFLPSMIQKAKNKGKDVGQIQTILRDAMVNHNITLQELEAKLPREFTWQPEKEAPTNLPIARLLGVARDIREKLLTFHVQ